MKRILAAIRKFCSNRVFSRLLVYYAVLVALFATVCVVSNYQAMRMSVDHTIDRNRIIYENSAATLRSAGESMDVLTSTLSGSSVVTSPLRSLLSGNMRTQIYDIYEVIHRLPQVSDNTGLIDGYFIYLPGHDSAVAPNQGFTAMSVYYKDYFALDPEQNYEEWHSSVLDCRTRSLHASWKDQSAIQYVVPLNNHYTGNVAVKLVYKINANRLLQQISGAFSNNLEFAAITDAEGKILAIDRGDEGTVAALAFHLGITGNYLSGLFKKQLGMNFSVHLEQVRIRHAESYLLGTAATIDEIAQQIGYTNSDSFRRAFRRVRGVSPSVFRANLEKSAL